MFRSLLAFSAVVALASVVVRAEEESVTLTPPADANAQVFPEGVSVTVDFMPEECSEISEKGQTLGMHYTGTIDESSEAGEKGKQFDSSVGRDVFKFPLGGGQVIKGWDAGLVGMCIGEKRTLILSPEMGYGERGAGGDIPGGATLKFTVELIEILAGGEGPNGGADEPNLFAEIDADKNHELTEDEIAAWFKSTMDKEVPEGLMEKEDADKDKVVSWEEFSGPKGKTNPKDEL